MRVRECDCTRRTKGRGVSTGDDSKRGSQQGTVVRTATARVPYSPAQRLDDSRRAAVQTGRAQQRQPSKRAPNGQLHAKSNSEGTRTDTLKSDTAPRRKKQHTPSHPFRAAVTPLFMEIDGQIVSLVNLSPADLVLTIGHTSWQCTLCALFLVLPNACVPVLLLVPLLVVSVEPRSSRLSVRLFRRSPTESPCLSLSSPSPRVAGVVMGNSFSSDELRWSKATHCRIRDAEWTRFAAQVTTHNSTAEEERGEEGREGGETQRERRTEEQRQTQGNIARLTRSGTVTLAC